MYLRNVDIVLNGFMILEYLLDKMCCATSKASTLKFSLQYDLYLNTGLLAFKAMMDLHHNRITSCTETFVNKF